MHKMNCQTNDQMTSNSQLDHFILKSKFFFCEETNVMAFWKEIHKEFSTNRIDGTAFLSSLVNEQMENISQ